MKYSWALVLSVCFVVVCVLDSGKDWMMLMLVWVVGVVSVVMYVIYVVSVVYGCNYFIVLCVFWLCV